MEIEKEFDRNVAINVVLYILQRLGGKADMHKIFKILYFAERKHLSVYGRRIVGDDFNAMQYGPVPSKIYDMLKGIRGDSFFSEEASKYCEYIKAVNKETFQAEKDYDGEYISESAKECLDEAVEMCKGLSFNQLTDLSHDFAWSNTSRNKIISYADMMREIGEDEGYAQYVQERIREEERYCIE